jgi:hypothetical protein
VCIVVLVGGVLSTAPKNAAGYNFSVAVWAFRKSCAAKFRFQSWAISPCD